MNGIVIFPTFSKGHEGSSGKSEKSPAKKFDPPLFSSGTNRVQLQCGFTASNSSLKHVIKSWSGATQFAW